MKFTQSIEISAEPQQVFAVYQNVADWPKWDPETEGASLEGDFAVGSMGKVKPKGAPESKILLTEVTQDRSFTVECKLPLCKMHFIHLMEPSDTGTKLVNEVEFTGLLAPIFGRLIGKGIDKGLPDSMGGLKKYVEQ